MLAFLVAGKLFVASSFQEGNYTISLFILVLTILSASSFGIMAASFIMVLKRGDPITWMFNSASALLGGVYFPVTVLPEWLQKVSLLLPTTHALKAMRLTLLKGASAMDVAGEIGALCVFCVVLLPLSLFVFLVCNPESEAGRQLDALLGPC